MKLKHVIRSRKYTIHTVSSFSGGHFSRSCKLSAAILSSIRRQHAKVKKSKRLSKNRDCVGQTCTCACVIKQSSCDRAALPFPQRQRAGYQSSSSSFLSPPRKLTYIPYGPLPVPWFIQILKLNNVVKVCLLCVLQ